jgi:hypothetical protein
LADAIEKVLWDEHNNEQTLSHASRWLKHFNIAAVSSQWARLLKDVFANGHPSPSESQQTVVPALDPGVGPVAIISKAE